MLDKDFLSWSSNGSAKNGEANTTVDSLTAFYDSDARIQGEWRRAIDETNDIIYKRNSEVINVKMIMPQLKTAMAHVLAQIPPIKVTRRFESKEAETDAIIKQAAINYERERMKAALHESTFAFEAMLSGYATMELFVEPVVRRGKELYELGMRHFSYKQVVWDGAATMPDFSDATRVFLHWKETVENLKLQYPQATDVLGTTFQSGDSRPADIDNATNQLFGITSNGIINPYAQVCRAYWIEKQENERGFYEDMVFYQDFFTVWTGGVFRYNLMPLMKATRPRNGGGMIPVVGVCYGTRDRENNRPIGAAEELRDLNQIFNHKVTDAVDNAGATSIIARQSSVMAMGGNDLAKGLEAIHEQALQRTTVLVASDENRPLDEQFKIDKKTDDMNKDIAIMQLVESMISNLIGVAGPAARGVNSNETSGVAIQNKVAQTASSLAHFMLNIFHARTLIAKIILADIEKFTEPQAVYTYIDNSRVTRKLNVAEKAKVHERFKKGYTFSHLPADIVIDAPNQSTIAERQQFADKLSMMAQTIKDPSLVIAAVMEMGVPNAIEIAEMLARSYARQGIVIDESLLSEEAQREVQEISAQFRQQQQQQQQMEMKKGEAEILKTNSLATANLARAKKDNPEIAAARKKAEATMMANGGKIIGEA